MSTPMLHTSHCPEMVRRCLSLQGREKIANCILCSSLKFHSRQVYILKLLFVLQEVLHKHPEGGHRMAAGLHVAESAVDLAGDFGIPH